MAVPTATNSNSVDPSFGQNLWGRPAVVVTGQPGCPVINFNPTANASGFSQMYSYTAAGLVTKKRLRVTRSGRIPGDLDALYTYDNEGKMTLVKYPDTYLNDLSLVTGATYTYGFDAMSRPVRLVDDQQNPVTWVSNATYGPSNELLVLTDGTSFQTETRQYNSRLQLTQITVQGMNIQYNYPASPGNNGRIASMVDSVSGETVTYGYDALNRLISANSSLGASYNQAYSYDGFGNMGSADPNTNRLLGQGYDANCNMTASQGMFNYGVYDVENRLSSLSPVSGGQEEYVYGPDNKRVSKIRPDGTEVIYFYGVGGQKLGEYQVQMSATMVYVVALNANLYFGGKLIRLQGQTVAMDRLGSVRALNGAATPRYYPYGMEYTTTAQDREKFGTYYRDSTTGLDYADQRYYASTQGRFLTTDPYRASATSPSKPANPQSWNRYAYVLNDPVNLYDPTGLQAEGPPINPYQGILDLIAGRLRSEWIDSLHREMPEELSDFERVKRERTSEFRVWSADALKNLGSGCIKVFNGQSGSADAYDSLFEEMIRNVDSIDFLDLAEESHRTATLETVFAGGSRINDPAWQRTLLEWTGDIGAPRAYAYGRTIILGLGFTLSQTPEGNAATYTTMVHEMLHLYTGLDDRGVAKRFNITFTDALGVAGITNASRAISGWLGRDCDRK